MAGDSSGKARATEGRQRLRNLVLTFVLGAGLGFIVADRAAMLHRATGGGDGGAATEAGGGRGGGGSAVVFGGGVSKSTKTDVAGECGCVADRYAPYEGPARNELEETLRKVAPSREVFAAVANKNYLWGEPPMMKTFTDGIKRAKIENHLVLALDDEMKAWCDQNGINVHRLNLKLHKVQADTGENHAVSAMKFGILKEFLDIGYSVLLSDVDIVVLQNPFDFLYRDHDVEGMTDGFEPRGAYGSIEGFDDPSMGWARFAQFYKRFNMNSGLFYLRANARTLELMTRLEDRLSKQKYWDQTAYNEEIFFMSHGKYKSPQVSVRIMELDQFMNSKYLFKDVRNRPRAQQPPMPVTVHINYHPDKHERMLAVVKYYVDGDGDALKSFPGGSEPGQR